jgi:peptidoglycan/xylan/chitin deacetylase (PgdA/CDA1 family)
MTTMVRGNWRILGLIFGVLAAASLLAYPGMGVEPSLGLATASHSPEPREGATRQSSLFPWTSFVSPAPATQGRETGTDSSEPGVEAASLSRAASPSRVVRRGARTDKVVALTFDDGWNEDACRSIADTLRSHGVTGTFFVNGIHLRNAPARWRAILRGFPVANHTRTHRWLTRIEEDSIRRQIRLNEHDHQKALGRPLLKILRPPYGAYDERVLRVAGELGYDRTVLWDVSSGDTTRGATVGSVIRNASRGRNGSVVLMHCGPSVTPAALPAIIRSYRDRGFELVGLDRLFPR